MCEPTTAMMVMTTVSGAMSAKAQYDQGQYQKGVAEYNAAVDRNKAVEVKNKANTQESAERQKAQQLLSKQRAIAASRGATVDFGTVLDITEDTEMIGEINARRVREGGEAQVTALEGQATLGLSAGNNAASQGSMGAIGTLLGTAGTVAGSIQPTQTVDPSWYQSGMAPSGSAGFGPGL